LVKKRKTERKESKAKTYLLKIKNYDTRIDSSLQDLADLEELVTRITPVLKPDIVSSSGNKDKLGDTVAKIADLREQINRETDEFVDLKEQALALLKKMDTQNPKHPEYYEILHQRYVKYYTFEKIAAEVGYCIRNIWNVHGRALQAFQKVLDEGKEN
jgi:DNA-directed RNA polymerase specialized sigma24 family protein